MTNKGGPGQNGFYKKRLLGEKKYYDVIPAQERPENRAGAPEAGDLDGGGERTVLDVDYAARRFGKL